MIEAAMGPGLKNAEQGWVEDAYCRTNGLNTDLFFPEQGATPWMAAQLCGPCTVKGDCLRFALDNDQWIGIWGGRSSRERRIIKEREARRRSRA